MLDRRMSLKSETGKNSFSNRLIRAGYSDFYVIDRESAMRLLTEKRIEIIEELRRQDFESVREMARELDRDVKQVSEDLELLHQISVIDFEENGRRKKPELRHEKIFIEPI